MKWITSQKWLLFCLCFFLVIGQGSLLWADDDGGPPEEEEEEPVQARPNPFEKSTLKGRATNSAKGGQVGRSPFDGNPSLQKNQMIKQTGKAMPKNVQSGAGSGQVARPGAAMK